MAPLLRAILQCFWEHTASPDRARRIIRDYRIEVVLVTAPPFSVFLIGNALKRDPDGVRRYERPRLAGELAQLIRERLFCESSQAG